MNIEKLRNLLDYNDIPTRCLEANIKRGMENKSKYLDLLGMNDGNVWRMGEYPEEYENGKFIEAPAWIHGIDDALAGIAMYSNPELNTSDYPQGWAPNEDWTDRGKVDQVGQQLCVPFDCYDNVLVIAETSKSEPGA